MGVRRANAVRGYEEMSGENVPDQLPSSANGTDMEILPQEFELASVSVVPDGKILNFNKTKKTHSYNQNKYFQTPSQLLKQ